MRAIDVYDKLRQKAIIKKTVEKGDRGKFCFKVGVGICELVKNCLEKARSV